MGKNILVHEKFSKKELYTKVFKQEFLRELEYLWDVANRRAKARDTFTTKLIEQLNGTARIVPIPMMAEVFERFTSALDFAANKVRDREIGCIANLRDQLDIKRLEVLLDVVAKEAYRRYEFFIENYLSNTPEEGVIPFAKVGVMRVLEYVARKHSGVTPLGLIREKMTIAKNSTEVESAGEMIELSESFLLAGLIEGRSGAWVQGFSNNKVSLNESQQEKFIEAEDVYARSAMCACEIINGQLKLELYYHLRPAAHQEGNKLKNIMKGETDSLFNFGYVKDNQKGEPIAGFVLMPPSVIKRYDFIQYADGKPSQNLVGKLNSMRWSTLSVDKATLQAYVNYARTKPNPVNFTVMDYLADQRICAGVQEVICQENLSGIDLHGINLNRVDLSGAILSGDLTDTQFEESRLIGTQFHDITSAKRTNFQRANCAFMRAENVNFEGSNFSQADLSYAKLKGSNLGMSNLMGTIWYKADLQNIKGDGVILEQILEKQKQQQMHLDEEIAINRDKLRQLSEDLIKQNQKINNLSQEMEEKIRFEVDRQERTLNQKLETLRQSNAGIIDQLMDEMVELQGDVGSQLMLLEKKLEEKFFEKNNQGGGQTQNFAEQIKAIIDEGKKEQEKISALSTDVQFLMQRQASHQTFEIYCRQQLASLETAVKSTVSQQEVEELKKQLGMQLASIQEENQKNALAFQQLEKKLVDFDIRITNIEKNQALTRPEYTLGIKVVELRKKILSDRYISQELAYYVEPNCKATLESDNISSLHRSVETELLKSDARVLLLKGEAGAGKSTFNRHLLQSLWQDPAWQNFKPNETIPKAYVPIFIALGSSKNNPNDLFRSLDFPELGISFTEAEIGVLKRDYHLLLIADGYDEMPNQAVNLYDANGLDQYQGRVKLLIGCRTQRAQMLETKEWFVPHTENGGNRYEFFRDCYIADFNEKQIADYLAKYLAKNSRQTDLKLFPDVLTYQKYIEQIPELKMLLKTPFLLLITVEILPGIIAEIESNRDEKNQFLVTRARLYDRFVEGWFSRQKEKLRLAGQLPERGDVKENYRQFSAALAKRFYENSITGVQYPIENRNKVGTLNLGEPTVVVDKWVEQLFGNGDKDIVKAREGSLLRTAGGNWHQFIHASLIDYFVTTALWQQSQAAVQIAEPKKQPQTDEKPLQASTSMPPSLSLVAPPVKLEIQEGFGADLLLHNQLLSRDQIIFAADRLKEDKEGKFQSYLWTLLRGSKKETSSSVAASNAISILNAAGVDFSNEDLQGVRIPGADLSGGVMDGANFLGADLRNVNFRGTWLRGANFIGADMQGVDFGLLPKVNLGKIYYKNKPKFIKELNQIARVDIENKSIDYIGVDTRKNLLSKQYKDGNVGFWASENFNYVYAYQRDTEAKEFFLCVWDVKAAREIVKFKSSEAVSQIHTVSNFVILFSMFSKKCHVINLYAPEDVFLYEIESGAKLPSSPTQAIPAFDSQWSSAPSFQTSIQGWDDKLHRGVISMVSMSGEANYLHLDFKKKQGFSFSLENSSSQTKFCWHPVHDFLFYFNYHRSYDTQTRFHLEEDLGVIDISRGNKLYDVTCSYQHTPYGTSMARSKPAYEKLTKQYLFTLYGFNHEEAWVSSGGINLSTSKVKYGSDVYFLWHPREALLVVLTKNTHQASIFVPFQNNQLILLSRANFIEMFYRTNSDFLELHSRSVTQGPSVLDYQAPFKMIESNCLNYHSLLAITDTIENLEPSENEITKYQVIIQNLAKKYSIQLPAVQTSLSLPLSGNRTSKKLNFAFAKHPNKPWIAFLLSASTIFIVDLNTERELRQIRRKLENDKTINSLTINTDEIFEWDSTGKFLIAGQESWNVDDYGTLRNIDNTLKFSKSEVSQDNKFMIAVSAKKDLVFVIDRATGRDVFSRKFNGIEIIDVGFQNNLLAVISTDNVLRVYAIFTQEKRHHHQLSLDLQYGASIQWHPNGKEILIKTRDSSNQVDFTGFVEIEFGVLKENYVKLFPEWLSRKNFQISIEPHGRYLIGSARSAITSGGPGGHLYIYDLGINKLMGNSASIALSFFGPSKIEWNKSGSFFLVDNNLCHYDTNEQKLSISSFNGSLVWHNDLLFITSVPQLQLGGSSQPGGSLIFKIQPAIADKIRIANPVETETLSATTYLQANYLKNSIKFKYYETGDFQLKVESELNFPFEITHVQTFFASNSWNVLVCSSDALMFFESFVLEDKLQHKLKWAKGALGFSLDQVRFSDITQLSDLNKTLLEEHGQLESTSSIAMALGSASATITQLKQPEAPFGQQGGSSLSLVASPSILTQFQLQDLQAFPGRNPTLEEELEAGAKNK